MRLSGAWCYGSYAWFYLVVAGYACWVHATVVMTNEHAMLWKTCMSLIPDCHHNVQPSLTQHLPATTKTR